MLNPKVDIQKQSKCIFYLFKEKICIFADISRFLVIFFLGICELSLTFRENSWIISVN